jgi:hypothetical protein
MGRMTERDLEGRLRAAANALDAEAPAFDVRRLPAARGSSARRTIVAVACALLVGAAVSPAAVSSLWRLVEVESVQELGPLGAGVAPAFAGRSVSLDAARMSATFPVRTIPSLGAPHGALVRDDVAGGLVTVVYEGGRLRLSQWRTTDVHARVTLVPEAGRAVDVTVGGLPALWVEGTARGTFTLVGADGAVHREAFEVARALLWEDEGTTLLLQGERSREDALALAAAARR